MTKPILVVLSSHPELGGEPNGTYMPELTHALHVLDDGGVPYTLASVKGGRPPSYRDDADEITREMLADPEFKARLEDTKPLASIDVEAFDAVFYPGGYGLLFDLVENADSQKLIASIYGRGGLVAAVCHGPAVLSDVTLEDGSKLIDGREMTGFTRGEEVAMSTLEKIPFVLEDRVIDSGAVYRKRKNWQSLVVRDGRLITGQNPQSAKGVGEALVEALGEV